MTYKIEWKVFNLEEALRQGFKAEENFLWYMIFLEEKWLGMSKGHELVYIGMVCDQTVSDRLLNKHEALKSCLRDLEHGIVIALGSWMGKEKSISKENIKNIEAAMIANFKPRLNGVGVKKYKGPAIVIESESDKDWDELNWDMKFIL